MKKLSILILTILSILTVNSSIINAHHYGPELGGHCTPGMHIEISGEYLFYDPLLGADCNLWWSTAMSNFYELIEIDIQIEHQRLIGGVWQDGPKDYQAGYNSFYIGTNLWSGGLYYLLGGGYLIEGFNTTDYDRYRLVVTLEGASTHYPTFTTPSDYDIRFDEYTTDWVYGLHATEINPSLDNAADGFADQPNPDDTIPDRPQDRDQDGVPDATDRCPDIVGPVALQGCPVSIDEMSNGRIPNLPSTGSVCTVETSLAMTFIFDVEPGTPIAVGTSPIALISDEAANANQATSWETARLNFGETLHDYMVYPAWSSLARTGGTCGAFDGSVSSTSS